MPKARSTSSASAQPASSSIAFQSSSPKRARLGWEVPAADDRDEESLSDPTRKPPESSSSILDELCITAMTGSSGWRPPITPPASTAPLTPETQGCSGCHLPREFCQCRVWPAQSPSYLDDDDSQASIAPKPASPSEAAMAVAAQAALSKAPPPPDALPEADAKYISKATAPAVTKGASKAETKAGAAAAASASPQPKNTLGGKPKPPAAAAAAAAPPKADPAS